MSDAAHGTVRLDALGNPVFVANTGYIGVARFQYTISDGHNGLAHATVYLNARPPRWSDGWLLQAIAG